MRIFNMRTFTVRTFKLLVAAWVLVACCGCAAMPRVWCADPNIQASVPIVECLAPEA